MTATKVNEPPKTNTGGLFGKSAGGLFGTSTGGGIFPSKSLDLSKTTELPTKNNNCNVFDGKRHLVETNSFISQNSQES